MERSAGDIKWDGAMLLIAVSDISGIVSLDMTLAGKPLKPMPGPAGAKLFHNGLQARADLEAGKSHAFTIKLSVNGSGATAVPAAGQSHDDRREERLARPGFHRRGPAADPHTIRHDGFTAHWDTTYISRPYPGQWRSSDMSADFPASAIGVELTRPATSISRATAS